MSWNKERVDRSLRAAEGILLLVGVLALGAYAAVHVSAAREQAALAQELEQQFSRKASSAAASPTPMHTVPRSGSVVARIEVPRLGMSTMAREGADALTLSKAVGHVPDTALPGEPGNAAFAGHRDTFFRPLKGIHKGDEIVVTTAAGQYVYAVDETRVVKPSDVWVLEPTGTATLTLVTCYPFNYIGAAPDRFIVRATRTK
jgi:sortase A